MSVWQKKRSEIVQENNGTQWEGRAREEKEGGASKEVPHFQRAPCHSIGFCCSLVRAFGISCTLLWALLPFIAIPQAVYIYIYIHYCMTCLIWGLNVVVKNGLKNFLFTQASDHWKTGPLTTDTYVTSQFSLSQ